MGDVLTPGQAGNNGCSSAEYTETPDYLIKDNYLGEFETDVDKEIARNNLNVHSKDEVYTKLQVDNLTTQKVNTAINTHLAQDDPHQIMPKVESILADFVKNDGTTPFMAPQTGVDPLTDFHLTTKRFVTNLLNSHLKATDPHNIIPLVEEALKEYVKASQVYLKGDLYTKKETDSLFTPFVRRDGSTPFQRPQSGITPTIASHLATKGYVDDKIYEHLVDVDPHGFITILNQRFANYYTKSETYSKAQTYSRAQIDAIINDLVRQAALSAIQEHVNDYDPHGTLKEIYSKHYVTRDGSVPFTDIQKGVAGVEDDDLVVLQQLNSLKEELTQSIDKGSVWITSGPVQTTVGFVEDNSPMPKQMTLQEIMDAIFYGKTIDVSSPEAAIVGEIVDVTMSIHSDALIETAELYQNGELIGTFTSEDFVDGVLVYKSKPITEDTVFTFKVIYSNGTELTAECMTKVAFGVFVGLLPKWYPGSNITYDFLMELINEDPDNNNKYADTDNLEAITHSYKFTSPTDMKHPFIAVPVSYPDLKTMVTESQHFGIEAFNVINDIPISIPGASKDVIYKIYIYKEALVAFNSEITFKFE